MASAHNKLLPSPVVKFRTSCRRWSLSIYRENLKVASSLNKLDWLPPIRKTLWLSATNDWHCWQLYITNHRHVISWLIMSSCNRSFLIVRNHLRQVIEWYYAARGQYSSEYFAYLYSFVCLLPYGLYNIGVLVYFAATGSSLEGGTQLNKTYLSLFFLWGYT